MRIVITIIGTILLLFGLVSLVTPIPGGIIAITVGGGMVICSSATAEQFVKTCRIKSARLNQAMSWIENKMWDRLSAPLRSTRPDATTDVKES